MLVFEICELLEVTELVQENNLESTPRVPMPRSQVGVEKLRVAATSCGLEKVRGSFSFSVLSGNGQRFGWLAEKPHQSLDILRSGCQEELLPNEPHAL